MTPFWSGILIGAIVSPIALGLLVLIFFAVVGLLQKTSAPGGCSVCDHIPTWEIGDHTNLRHRLVTLRHNLLWLWRPWHRLAWAHHRWNSENPRQNGDTWHSVVCGNPDHGWRSSGVSVKGPYDDIDVARIVARKHEIARHGGASATTIETYSKG